MTTSQSILFWVFVLLLTAATGFAVYKRSLAGSKQDYTFDIEGFEPNDVLTSHALKYKIKYGPDMCKGITTATEAYVCLDPKGFALRWPENCARAIRGVCQDEQFTAGIERFYVRQEHAQDVTRKLSGRRVGISVSVTPNGLAQVKDLLIDGIPWQNAP